MCWLRIIGVLPTDTTLSPCTDTAGRNSLEKIHAAVNVLKSDSNGYTQLGQALGRVLGTIRRKFGPLVRGAFIDRLLHQDLRTRFQKIQPPGVYRNLDKE